MSNSSLFWTFYVSHCSTRFSYDFSDHCQDDKHSIDAVENVATVKVEVESEVIATAAPVTEVKKKKNRRRKGGSAVVKVEDTFM